MTPSFSDLMDGLPLREIHISVFITASGKWRSRDTADDRFQWKKSRVQADCVTEATQPEATGAGSAKHG